MLSLLIQFLIFATYIALMVLVWRVSKKPGWRVRAVIYGWGGSFLWALFWATLMPIWLRGYLDKETLLATFPEGTLILAFLFLGWFYPLIIASISHNLQRKRTGG
jgi:hypothetical protein